MSGGKQSRDVRPEVMNACGRPLTRLLLQHLRQSLPRPVQPGLHRLFRQTKLLGGLGHCQAFEGCEDERGFETVGQGADRRLGPLELVSVGRGAFWVGGVVRRIPLGAGTGHRAEIDPEAHARLSLFVAAFVSHDSAHPRLEGVGGIVFAQRPPGRNERLLDHVVGEVLIADMATSKPVQRLLGPANEQGERPVLAGERPGRQVAVR